MANKNDSPTEIGTTVQDCAGVDTKITYICSPARRISARIQKIESNKAAVRLRQREEESLTKPADKPVKKKQRLNHPKQKGSSGNVQTDLVKDEGIAAVVVSNSNGAIEQTEKLKSEEKREEVEVGSTSMGQVGEKSVYAMVTDTIRAFNTHYLYFVQVF